MTLSLRTKKSDLPSMGDCFFATKYYFIIGRCQHYPLPPKKFKMY